MIPARLRRGFVAICICLSPLARADLDIPMLPKNTKQGLKSLFDQGTDVFSSFAELRRQVLEQKDRAALSKIYGMAQHGFIDAINFLGYLYDNGEGGVAKNPRLAAKFWYTAAKQGDALALHNLGLLYWQGRGLPKQEATARQLLGMASDRFITRSDIVLGLIAESHNDATNAIHYFAEASAQKHPNIAARQAMLLLKAQGPSAADQAFSMLLQAAEQGDPLAQFNLARFYGAGLGNTGNQTNPVEASYWLNILQSNPFGKPYWNLIPTSLRTYNITDLEFSHAKSSADEWIKQHPTLPVPTDYAKSIYIADETM
ncbi:MAG TPA: tetratricopeptide repeat protein [Nitrospira sp.]|nr:tetratricopeptide repeat protein [Nitrospira sp.]HMW87826.1 tetratricopeptide repeat protein [Nitrospira sp.]HNE33651.1 tetratricopeptide repeat protein [Nitrospira sp.]